MSFRSLHVSYPLHILSLIHECKATAKMVRPQRYLLHYIPSRYRPLNFLYNIVVEQLEGLRVLASSYPIRCTSQPSHSGPLCRSRPQYRSCTPDTLAFRTWRNIVQVHIVALPYLMGPTRQQREHPRKDQGAVLPRQLILQPQSLLRVFVIQN